MKKAIYAGSFDPFHCGHSNIVNRALNVFDEVYILVADNPSKTYKFTAAERIDIIKNTINSNKIIVDILKNTQLVSDYAREHGIITIIKGIRNIQDTEYERMLHEVTVSQENGIDTFVLFSTPTDQKISSSAVKELIRFNADVTNYIPLYTKQLLEEKNEQYIMGITGQIGTGKSFISSLLEKVNVPVTNIDLDLISQNITYFTPDSEYANNAEIKKLSRDVKKLLNLNDSEMNISNENLKKLLMLRVFSNTDFNKKLQNLYKPVIIHEIRKQMAGKKGLIILNGALLIEMGITHLCNNNMVVVDAPVSEINDRLLMRYNNQSNVNGRVSAQLSNAEKCHALAAEILKCNHGKYCIINNSKGHPIFDAESLSEKSRILCVELLYNGFFDYIGLKNVA